MIALPIAISLFGFMRTIGGLKTCRKRLHQYSPDLPQCPECREISIENWRNLNADRHRENIRRWKKANPDKVR